MPIGVHSYYPNLFPFSPWTLKSSQNIPHLSRECKSKIDSKEFAQDGSNSRIVDSARDSAATCWKLHCLDSLECEDTPPAYRISLGYFSLEYSVGKKQILQTSFYGKNMIRLCSAVALFFYSQVASNAVSNV